jgi:hypothetical protein
VGVVGGQRVDKGALLHQSRVVVEWSWLREGYCAQHVVGFFLDWLYYAETLGWRLNDEKMRVAQIPYIVHMLQNRVKKMFWKVFSLHKLDYFVWIRRLLQNTLAVMQVVLDFRGLQ